MLLIIYLSASVTISVSNSSFCNTRKSQPKEPHQNVQFPLMELTAHETVSKDPSVDNYAIKKQELWLDLNLHEMKEIFCRKQKKI